MIFTIAICGRPNVGKSTLFNRLIGKKLALVDDQPGVTRDLREGEAKLRNVKVKFIDTAGLESAAEETLQHRMSSLSFSAIKEADACLFVIDARKGITAADESYALLVRRTSKLVMLVANKVEGRAAENGIYESFSLGLGDPIAISAEHGIGIDELQRELLKVVQLANDSSESDRNKRFPIVDYKWMNENLDVSKNSSILSRDKEIQLSIIGRPNSGKSTLINKIANNKRLLTGPEAGITRDAISSSVK